MSVNDLFNKIPVEIPNKSGFDLSHENLFTAKVGELVPCMVHEMLPNDTISLGVSSQIQLPPMATDFYGRVKAHFEAFFVPNRLLYGGWQELITHNSNEGYPSGSTSGQKARYLPQLRIPTNNMGAGSLSDYLQCVPIRPVTSEAEPTFQRVNNPLRFLAYHKIWDDWYRDSRLQVSAFEKAVLGDDSTNTLSFSHLPWLTTPDDAVLSADTDVSLKCADGHLFYISRQRNWARDYFTNATPTPQAGDAAALSFSVSNNTGAFTIASLRAANSLQQWLERNNIAGFRYGDQIRAQFGIYPADATMDRAIYLGRQIVNVYNRSVYQQGTAPESRNPFASVGSKYGSPQGVGDGSLVDKFTASEHGILMVMFSLVPDAIYDCGSHRSFAYRQAADFPFPILSGVGDQPIYINELMHGFTGGNEPNPVISSSSNVFGYSQRYSEAKFMLDEVHGLLKDGHSLDAFALKRSFPVTNNVSSFPSLGSEFLEIPQSFLDDVSAVSQSVSNYGCWVDSYFSFKKVSTLPAYSIPTLGDMKNTHTEVVPNGGTRL